MFENDSSYTELESLLLPQEQYRPFPKAEDREAWEAVPEDVRSALIAKAEERLEYAWPALPAIRYMDFARNGNRSRYERLYFDRRQALGQLVVAECLENEGRFIEQIINGIWCICEESSWVVPAHMYISVKSRGDSLPDITDPVIDLFAGETAGLLAWTSYLLGAKLNQESPMIGRRILLEMKRRILDPFLEREDFWWMGFTPNRTVNNWNPWINSNVIASFLLCERDDARRVQALRKAFRSLDAFMAVYHSDGGCDEGPGYWGRAGASLFECLELFYTASDGKINFYSQPLVKEIGRYIYRAHISGRYFVNFADGDAMLSISAELVARYGERIGDPRMVAMGRSAMRKENIIKDSILSLMRAIPAVLSYGKWQGDPPSPPFVRDVWLDGIQVMTAREQEGSDRGLFLTAKGGHNAESHNHNDVGQFMVYLDGKPFLIDIGVETYTAKTFSPRRYEIWTMQSGYHNLPAIDGIEQSPGREYSASDVQYESDEAGAQLSMNIAGAYPESAGIRAWIRTCRLERGGAARVRIRDRFKLDKTAQRITLSLMTPYEPQLETDSIILAYDENLRLRVRFDGTALAAASERIAVEDKRLQNVWGEALYRIVLANRSPAAEGDWLLEIEKMEPGAS